MNARPTLIAAALVSALMALAVAPCIVVVAAQVSASLAWLAVSSEEAPGGREYRLRAHLPSD